MNDENLQRYILSYLNLCTGCNKYYIVNGKYVCRRCKIIMCEECSLKVMVIGADDSETHCRYCKTCFLS